jgi:RHS repeat-associated protein
MTWDRDGIRPVSQVERRTMANAPQHVVDQRFFAIVTDLIGTPTELVDESGGIAWHARRTLWGVTSRAADTTTDTPLRFPGQYFDPETGLHYNYFRHYDPATAQYTSPDPLGLAGGPNQRSYAPNPLAWLDYLGLLTCRQNARRLRRNMRREGRGPGPGQAAAHIVPSGGSQNQWAWGARSRQLLDDHDVDVNDPANGIPLGDPSPHNYTHRGPFLERVYNRLQRIVTQGQARGLDTPAIGSMLRNELRSIGRQVEAELAGGSPAPGAYWTA